MRRACKEALASPTGGSNFSTKEDKTSFIPKPVFAETSIPSSPGKPITSSICFLILSGSEAGKSI